MVILDGDDQLVVALVGAIRGGDVGVLRRLLDEYAGLASLKIGDEKGGSRTPLHVAADWPG